MKKLCISILALTLYVSYNSFSMDSDDSIDWSDDIELKRHPSLIQSVIDKNQDQFNTALVLEKNIDIKNEALNWAIYYNRKKMIEALLQNGADINAYKGTLIITALNQTIQNDWDLELLKLLFARGATKNDLLLTIAKNSKRKDVLLDLFEKYQ